MSARALLERLTAQGVRVRLDGEDVCLAVEPPRTIDEALVAEIRAAKPEVVAELRRRSLRPAATKPTPAPAAGIVATRRGVICGVCKRLGIGYGDDEAGYACPECAEWRAAGCPGFATLATCDDAAEMQFGACLRCGASWPMHGRPPNHEWARFAEPDDALPAATRFILARAREIARGVA